MPNVHQHFSNGGVMWSIICAKWFICIYADVLPIEVRFCSLKVIAGS